MIGRRLPGSDGCSLMGIADNLRGLLGPRARGRAAQPSTGLSPGTQITARLDGREGGRHNDALQRPPPPPP
jgi:hypothetical protein